MHSSPFKFLDSYTRDDRAIFFGRDREIEELYHRVFESKIMLVYGVSGTGKSSLINCGLANKFQDTDWLPISVRRAGDIIQSMAFAIQQAAITPLESENLSPKFFKKAVKSIYLDHYKPVFFIFDQVEELFIFGNRQEQKEFFQLVKSLLDSDLSCRFIFVLRKEYLADVSEFERLIPTLMANRVNIERMTLSNATQAIEGPCKVSSIQLEEGFSEALLERLSPGCTEVELTYLQVFLDKLYHMAAKDNKADTINFSKSLLEKTGNVSDLLGSFLDDQISLLEDPDTALAVLKSFVSVKGTKRQMSPEEIQDYAQTLGKPVEGNELQELIQTFIHLRILRDKDQNIRYELRHDALAEKIYEKITLVEKELLEIRQLIENAYHNWQKRGVLISEDDLKYIAPFESRLYLSKDFEALVENSKFSLVRGKRRRRNFAFGAVLVLLLVFGGFTIWALKERKVAELQKEKAVAANENAVKAEESALQERNRAMENENAANLAKEEAEIAKANAINAKQIAEQELYVNIKNSLSVSAEKMNVLYLGVPNPISISVSGVSNEKLIISVDNGSITYKNGLYYIHPQKPPTANITVYGKIKSNKNELIGTKTFRVKSVPDPYATFAGKTGGIILKEVAFATKEVEAKLDMDFDLNFTAKSFVMSSSLESGFTLVESSESNLLTQGQFKIIGLIKHNGRLYIESVNLLGPGGDIRKVNDMVFRIFDYQSVIESRNDSLMHKAAVDFYNASYNDKEKYLLHSLEIFNAMNERKPDDIFDELNVLQNYYRVEPSIEIENKIKGNFGKLMAYDWQPSDIDTVFGSNIIAIYDILTFIDRIHLSLGFPEFFIQLTDKLLKSQSINEKGLLTQLSRNISMKYAENVKTYDYSIKLLSDILKVDSSDVKAKIQLLGIYKNQQKDFPSEDLRNKIDILDKELLLVNDIDGLGEVEVYFYNKFYRNEIPWSSANIQKYLSVCKKIVNQDSDSSWVRLNTSYSLCSMTYYLLFKKEFKFALQSIQLAITADEKNEKIYQYLPLVYLLNNQYEDAEKVYNTWKDKPIANDRFKTFSDDFLRDIEDLEIQGITHPDFKKIKEIVLGAKEMPSEQGDPNIFINGKLGNGFNMGVVSSGGKTEWLVNTGKSLCLNYPEGQSWGVFWITLNEPLESQNLKRNYAQYSKLCLELKGEKGGETVSITIMDILDPVDGSESKAQLSLTNDWKLYEIDIAKNFYTAYLPKLHVVTQFVFGTEPQTIYVRKIQFLK